MSTMELSTGGNSRHELLISPVRLKPPDERHRQNNEGR